MSIETILGSSVFGRKLMRLAVAIFVSWVVTAAVFAAEGTATDCAAPGVRWPSGPSRDVLVDDEKVVFNVGSDLVLGSYTAADGLMITGSTSRNGFKGLVEAGGKVGVFFGSRFQLLDLTDLSSPVILDTIDVASEINDVVVSGGRALLASDDGLHILDIADPHQIATITDYAKDSGYVGVKISGNTVYALSSVEGLEILDISTPQTIVRLGRFEPEDPHEYFTRLDVFDSLVYIANDGYEGWKLKIVAVHDPENPSLVNTLSSSSDPFSFVEVRGDLLYLTESYHGGLFVMDISDPRNPVEIDTLYTMEDVRSIGILGDLVFTASDVGLEIFEWTLRGSQARVGGYFAGGGAARSVLVDGLIVIGGGYLRIVEKGPGARHAEISQIIEQTYGTADVTRDLFAREQEVYWLHRVGGSGEALSLIDISDPSSLREIERVSGRFERFAVHSNRVSVVGPDELTVFEESPPDSQLSVLGRLSLPAPAHAIAARDTTVVIAAEDQGLLVVDVAKPTPVIVGSYEMAGPGSGIAIVEDVAYVTGFEGGLRAIDISDRSQPTELGRFDTPEAALDIQLSGSCAFVVYPTLVRVVDISDPTKLEEKALVRTGESFQSIALGAGTAVLSKGRRGISFLDIAECGCELPRRSLFVPAAAAGPGVGESRWSTDIVINNAANTMQSYEITFLPEGFDNADRPPDASFTLMPGYSVEYRDVVGDLFQVDEGSGAVRIDAVDGGALLITSRTSSTDDTGATFGQGIPALSESCLSGPNQRLRLIQLDEDDRFRSNVGFMNGSPSPITINVEFFSSSGEFFGRRILELAPYGYRQWNRAFRLVEAPHAVENGYVEVWAETPGAKFTTYASVVDMKSHDPTYIAPQPVSGEMRGCTGP